MKTHLEIAIEEKLRPLRYVIELIQQGSLPLAAGMGFAKAMLPEPNTYFPVEVEAAVRQTWDTAFPGDPLP